jgi:uncharacterized protein YndB with AHSA1/START domain
MTDYRFLTIWHLEAPIESVWDAINNYQCWPNWWKAVESVVEVKGASDSQTESVWRFTWKTPLSYKLMFNSHITQINAPVLLELVARGDLEGVGLWELEGGMESTIVRYTWTVKTTLVWMNILAVFIRPLLEWNHNAIMQQGGEGLAKHLNARLIRSESH